MCEPSTFETWHVVACAAAPAARVARMERRIVNVFFLRGACECEGRMRRDEGCELRLRMEIAGTKALCVSFTESAPRAV